MYLLVFLRVKGQQMIQKANQRGRGPQRTSRQDWIDAALKILISEGVEQVKVLALAENLNCARSSFYWYFENRDDLLNNLLDYWKLTNTHAIVWQAQLPATTINGAMVNIFRCWVDADLFNSRLDFAVREWARRSDKVRRELDISDEARLNALAGMFGRYGFSATEASVRARIVYFTQIGYYALDVSETAQVRMARAEDYLFCMTGQHPTKDEVDRLAKNAGLLLT